MKKILITGADSYIGTSFEGFMKEFSEYTIDTLDMLDKNWEKFDFKGYDTVFHVAGLAHSTPKKSEKDYYYSINTDLAVKTAEIAKSAGVKQFIFMSSIIIYGNKVSCVNIDTKPNPNNFYGDSKFKADLRLHELEDNNFKVVSLRPPMIYGKGSKGNYLRLSKLAKKIKFFPNINNERSMLYIGNFCHFVKLIIDNEENGYFYPQNKEYVNTFNLVKSIAKVKGNNIIGISFFNNIIKKLSVSSILFNKLFGNLVYDKELSAYKEDYQKISFEESIDLTEN